MKNKGKIIFYVFYALSAIIGIIYAINSMDVYGKFDLGQMLAKLILGAAFYGFVLWLVEGNKNNNNDN